VSEAAHPDAARREAPRHDVPRHEAAAGDDPAWPPRPAEDTGPVDILIVDDRPENLLALEALLEPLGQRIVSAHSGDEALRQLLVRDFALILLDVQMPGINGFETARMIKSRERSRHIPIIFLTAINKEESYVFQGYEVGAVDYLFKPFNPDVLRSKVAGVRGACTTRASAAPQERALRDGERPRAGAEHAREPAGAGGAERRAARGTNRQLQERPARARERRCSRAAGSTRR
jgi:CheY-like chemotaxis protein